MRFAMTEKFEFNSEVYMDDVRQIPEQINVAKNAQGVLEEHMGDASIKGDDIYRIPVNDTALMLTVDGDSTVRLYSKDFEHNRHLASLTVVASTINGIRLRETNTVVRARLTNVYMRDSYIGFSEGFVSYSLRDIEDIHVEHSKLVDSWFTDELNRDMDVVIYIRSSVLNNSSVLTSKPVDIQSSRIERCQLQSFGERVVVDRAVLTDVNIKSRNQLYIVNGTWSDLQFEPHSVDVVDQFQMCRIDSPLGPFYFYHAGEGIYYVESAGGYSYLQVDPTFAPQFKEQIVKMITTLAEPPEYELSVAQFVFDSLQSRMKVIEAMERLGYFKKWSIPNVKKGGEE